ncbi:hypothetical protein BDA99DRAFT_608395 [Phascolomyces articulosus]|uniref:Galactose oxidase n=1 Tax=Phascolomyces articulosus TaxID=60185 RepID=A0AAD5JR74_9FUNG|nr:hypothetical protein BDA99DRAFT_608388 [Phascolomyces articulosus]KAI9250539.1 hypothetical protein BDA99DRAFT_608395 [Phascolomyces articulosus]
MELSKQGQLIQTTGVNLVGLWCPSFAKINQKLYVFGGGGVVRNGLNVLDLRTMRWEPVKNIKGTPPSKRYGHTLSQWNNHLIVFSGCGEENEYYNDMHMFNLDTSTWIQPNTKNNKKEKTERYLHSVVVFDDKLFVYCGFSKDSEHITYVLKEMNVSDLKTFVWSTYRKGIKRRYDHSAILVKNKMYIYAGKDYASKNVSDLFVIHLNEEEKTKPHPYMVHLVQTSSNSEMVPLKGLHYCKAIGNKKIFVFGRFYLDAKENGTSQENDIYSYYDGIWFLDLETLNWKRYHESLTYEDYNKFNNGRWNYFTIVNRTNIMLHEQRYDIINNDKELLFLLGNTNSFRPQGDALILDVEEPSPTQEGYQDFLRAKY